VKILIILTPLFALVAASTSSANIFTCHDEGQKTSIQFVLNQKTKDQAASGELTINNTTLDCFNLIIEPASITCTAIDFETAGAVVLKLPAISQDSSSQAIKAQFEILPPPGSGKIQTTEIECLNVF
jgi:hypothetical protein